MFNSHTFSILIININRIRLIIQNDAVAVDLRPPSSSQIILYLAWLLTIVHCYINY